MDLPALSHAIMTGQRVEAVAQTRQAIDAGLSARDILDAMVAAMDAIGRRFQNHEIFVPDMLMAARAMKESMSLLEPLLIKAGIQPELTAVIGTG